MSLVYLEDVEVGGKAAAFKNGRETFFLALRGDALPLRRLRREFGLAESDGPTKQYAVVLGLGFLASFFMVGQTKIELLESTDPEGPIGKFIEKRGEGIHHLAFAQQDVQTALQHAEKSGVRLIDQVPRKGAEGLNIGFLHPKSTFGVLMEFCGKE